jgi:hypothetical protein
MRLSVTLPDRDVAYLDAYARKGHKSRSAALHEAVLALRATELAGAYEDACDTWESSGDSVAWDYVSGPDLT